MTNRFVLNCCRLISLLLMFFFPIFSSAAHLENSIKSFNQNQEKQNPAAADTSAIVKEQTHLVSLLVNVTDLDNRFVIGLEPKHFEIYDDNVLQKIEFFSDTDAPLSVGIIFDTSGSMRTRTTQSFVALRKFLNTCSEKDENFLIGFNNQAKLLLDFTNDPEEISSRLIMIEPKGQTALYDAVYLGIEKIRKAKHLRKALIIISDGQDNNSQHSYRELYRLAKESNAQIYAIGITNIFSDDILDFEGRINLNELASLTGGSAFFPKSELGMQEAINQIGVELRHQYSIGYTPSSQIQDNRWHKIKVKIISPKELPRLIARTKAGYFSKN